jgi:hypothetical protein
MKQALKTITSAIALVACTAGHAATYTTPDAVVETFGGDLVVKSDWGVSGAGISGGPSHDEIDIGESLAVTFTNAVRITGIQLAYLYDGPEFGDVQEAARITATFADLTTASYTLVAAFNSAYSWNGLGSVAGPASNIDQSGGFWTLTNPFGNLAVTGLSFTAVEGLCPGGNCYSQSDFAVAGIATAPVPEPETYALMLAGLAGVAFMARRRRRNG